MTFGDLCRSNGGSYDFGAMETFDRYANIYKCTDFRPNRTGGSFPNGPSHVLSKNMQNFKQKCQERQLMSPECYRIFPNLSRTFFQLLESEKKGCGLDSEIYGICSRALQPYFRRYSSHLKNPGKTWQFL